MDCSPPVSGLCLSSPVFAIAIQFHFNFCRGQFVVRVVQSEEIQTKLKSAGLDTVTVCSFVRTFCLFKARKILLRVRVNDNSSNNNNTTLAS